MKRLFFIADTLSSTLSNPSEISMTDLWLHGPNLLEYWNIIHFSLILSNFPVIPNFDKHQQVIWTSLINQATAPITVLAHLHIFKVYLALPVRAALQFFDEYQHWATIDTVTTHSSNNCHTWRMVTKHHRCEVQDSICDTYISTVLLIYNGVCRKLKQTSCNCFSNISIISLLF